MSLLLLSVSVSLSIDYPDLLVPDDSTVDEPNGENLTERTRTEQHFPPRRSPQCNHNSQTGMCLKEEGDVMTWTY